MSSISAFHWNELQNTYGVIDQKCFCFIFVVTSFETSVVIKLHVCTAQTSVGVTVSIPDTFKLMVLFTISHNYATIYFCKGFLKINYRLLISDLQMFVVFMFFC